MELSRDQSHRQRQCGVTDGHEPQRRRLARHHVAVAGGELDQRERHRRYGGRGEGGHPPGEGQRRERDHPDEELR